MHCYQGLQNVSTCPSRVCFCLSRVFAQLTRRLLMYSYPAITVIIMAAIVQIGTAMVAGLLWLG